MLAASRLPQGVHKEMSCLIVCIVLQVLILVAAALITTVTNKLLYYFALYTNHLERWDYACLHILLCLTARSFSAHFYSHMTGLANIHFAAKRLTHVQGST